MIFVNSQILNNKSALLIEIKFYLESLVHKLFLSIILVPCDRFTFCVKNSSWDLKSI